MCKYCRELGENEIATEFFSRRYGLGVFGTGFITMTIVRSGGVPSLSVALGATTTGGKKSNTKGIIMTRPIHYCPMCGRALEPRADEEPRRYKDQDPGLYAAVKKEYLKGKTLQQIADKLHISRDRVKYRLDVMKRRGEIQVEHKE